MPGAVVAKLGRLKDGEAGRPDVGSGFVAKQFRYYDCIYAIQKNEPCLIANIICEHIEKNFITDKLDNNDLVQIIEHIGGLLNLQTISDYSRQNNISYNGAKNFRTNVTLFGNKFIIDNE